MQAEARHILICFHDFNRGGTERIAIGMAKRWVDQGRRVTILCGMGVGGVRDTVDPRVEVVELDPPLPRSLTSRLRLGPAMAPYIERLAPDVIFLPGNFHFPLAPSLSRIHGRGALVAKISNPAVPSGIFAPVVRGLLRRYRHTVDGLAAMNSGLEREIRAISPDFNVSTLYDPVYLHGDLDTPVERVDDGRCYIVWAGRFEPQKDAGLALRTIAALNERTPAHLTMLGDGKEFDAFRAQAERLGLADIVAMPGYVPEIDPWLRGADALLVTSHFEGGPAVAVEALAHGVPVVSTDCSHFLHDVMARPEAGRIVASRDPHALAEALLAVCRVGRVAPDVVQPLIAHLRPDACADAYLAWFEAVLAQRSAFAPLQRDAGSP